MKRCSIVLIIATLISWGGCAFAQNPPVPSTRPLPLGALRGTLMLRTAPDIFLNGQPARLSPGSRIHGLRNMTVSPNTLLGQTWQVDYLRDSTGLVHEVWLLDSTSTQTGPDLADTPRNFRFDSEGTTRVDDGKTPYHQLPRYPR